MIIKAEIPILEKREIVAHTREEFIDRIHESFSWYWVGDTDLGKISEAWNKLVDTGWVYYRGVVFSVKA